MPPIKWDAPDTIIQTDSCLQSCGGYSLGEAFTAKFPKWLKKLSNVHINELELLAFVISVKIWREKKRTEMSSHTQTARSRSRSSIRVEPAMCLLKTA